MILMRLDGIQGKFCDITGGQPGYKYGEKDSGWMPIESMNFGFQGLDGKPSKKSGATGSQSGGGPSAPTSTSVQEDFSRISISRVVDLATPQLMGESMVDRKVTKSNAAELSKAGKLRKADFHFLDSVMGKSSGIDARHIFPYLMITLEDVVIKSWSISGSGDNRPTESLELYYDKAALRYYRTRDGKEWIGGDIKGWDQHAGDFWQISEGGEPEYFKRPRT